MVKAKSKPKDSPLSFHEKLVLNQYVLRQFGIQTFAEFSRQMTQKCECPGSEGMSAFYKQLVFKYHDMLKISKDRIAQYDVNIMSHLRKINKNRDDKIKLKYFQYLSLLFVEYYLDEYFNNRHGLLTALNTYVTSFNAVQDPVNHIDPYRENDLNKLALWSATGSGKTLLMHMNYHQFHYYAKQYISGHDCSFILLTPNEGLSLQHLDECKASGIPVSLYQKGVTRKFININEIHILENTKLADKDGEKTVAAARFGAKNMVFVDEGHRGASGDVWYNYRNRLCENGFSIEYSATFGQAVSDNSKLAQQYAKCILFDYSYKYFYNDGYGKDYNILNLQDGSDEHTRLLYLTACLLTYYQQKKLYKSNKQQFAPFNIEEPLLVFVGGSVNAVRTKNKRQVSDVVDILLFLSDFIMKSSVFIPLIERIQSGHTGLLHHRNADVFRDAFPFLSSLTMSATDIYTDLLVLVFNGKRPGTVLHIESLKSVPGEIRIRLGENDPFGVIHVGDTHALLRLCDQHGLHTASVGFTGSLFHTIARPDSTVHLLIGAKKFTEGWNCWRVSTMGLMNVGRSEGSEIIQLFGRGVRLKGYAMSLKRSYFYIKDNREVQAPDYISLLETLNIFGVRADYMKQFKEYLIKEEVPTGKERPYHEKSPIPAFKVRGDLDYKKHAPKLAFAEKANLEIMTLDCYGNVQFETSGRERAVTDITKQEGHFDEMHLAGLDYEHIYFELERYKSEKAWHNFNIAKNDIKPLLADTTWYKLLIPREELELNSMEDFTRWTKIAIILLKKYCRHYYYMKKRQWEESLRTES